MKDRSDGRMGRTMSERSYDGATSRSGIVQRHNELYSEHDILTGNVLFNDALNTFYIRLYGVRLTRRPFQTEVVDREGQQPVGIAKLYVTT